MAEKAIPWQSPDYSGQEETLGYSEGVFDIPEELKPRVQFWIDIYTKYTSSEGILHDAGHIENVFEVVTFKDIVENSELSEYQKRRLKKKRVREAKKRIRARLRKLHYAKNPDKLEGEDLRLWKMYEGVKERSKFIRASRRGRLRFQLGQRDRFREAIFASGRYMQKMEEIFRKEKLPTELIRLPFVESSFNVFAYSKAGASGLWQLMPGTARRHLKISFLVDERNDPIRATEVAAHVLKTNYQMLGSWPLALTGYNHGPYGVRRLVRRLKTTDLPEIIQRERKRRFGFASENFYSTFLAALHVEQNAHKYFGSIYRSPSLPSYQVKLKRRVKIDKLKEWFDNDEYRVRLYNPHLLPSVIRGQNPVPRETVIRIPEDRRRVAVAYLESDYEEPNLAKYYRVSRGDTLSEIAERYGVSLRRLIQINSLSNAHRLRIGQKLYIPH